MFVSHYRGCNTLQKSNFYSWTLDLLMFFCTWRKPSTENAAGTKVCLFEWRLKTNSQTIFLPLLSISGITVAEIKSWRSFTVHAEFMEVQLTTFQASHSKSHLTQVSRMMRLSAPYCKPFTLRSHLQSWPRYSVVWLDHLAEKHCLTCVLPKRNAKVNSF